MDKQLLTRNRANIENYLLDNSVFVLLAGAAPHKSKDQHYHFSVNRNFYYLTGLDKEHMLFVMTKRGEKVTQTLFIERPDPTAEKWTGRRLREEEAKELSGIDSVMYLDNFQNYITRLFGNGSFEYLYLDLEHAGWDAPVTPANRFAQEMSARYPYLAIKNVHAEIGKSRMVKTDYEVEQMRKAIAITKDGILNIFTHAKPGVMEYELEAHFNQTLRAAGVKEHAFGTIMAGGARGTVLHYEENDHAVEDNELVLADLGAAWKYYCADITRTFPINGKFTERQKTFYEIVLKAQEATIAAIRPGVKFSELQGVTKSVLTAELKAIGLISNDEDIAKYYYHGVSHSLGLDVHDVGDNEVPLQPGYVVTVEPGLYIAEESIGIRIEEDVLVTEDGCEVLSKDIIKTVAEIEAFMAGRSK